MYTGAFLPRTSELYSRILLQWANHSSINKQIPKGFQRYRNVLKKYDKNSKEFVQELKSYCLQNNHDQISTSCL